MIYPIKWVHFAPQVYFVPEVHFTPVDPIYQLHETYYDLPRWHLSDIEEIEKLYISCIKLLWPAQVTPGGYK